MPARLEALAALGGMSPAALRSQAAAAIQVVLHVRRGRDGRRVLEGVGVVRRGDAEGLVVAPAWGREGGWAAGRADLGAMFAERGVEAPWPGVGRGCSAGAAARRGRLPASGGDRVSGVQAVSPVLAAVAVLAWPPASAAGRGAAWHRAPGGRAAPGGWRSRRVPVLVPAAAGLLLAVLLAGAGGAVAVSVLGAVVLRARRARRRERERTETTAGLAEGLAAFAGELRAGHPPATAAAAAGRDAGPACHRALALVEATARLGGDVPAALREHAATDPLAGPHLVRLADAWSLADRHGIGLAGLAEAVAEDLRARSRFAGRLSAQLAGPGPPPPSSPASRGSAWCSASSSARTRWAC